MRRTDTWDQSKLTGGSSAGKRGASPPAPDPMSSPKRQRLEQEVKSRPALKEMLKRPVAPQLDSETDDLVIQIVDVHELDDSAHLVITGITEAGNSVSAFIAGFSPYFYALPMSPEFCGNDTDLEALEVFLKGAPGYVTDLEVLDKNLKGEIRTLVKITFEDIGSFGTIRGIFDDTCPYEAVEANIDYPTRFLADHGLPGLGGWVKFPAKKYEVIPDAECVCRSQIEIEISHDMVEACEGFSNFPLRVLSFDIECMYDTKNKSDPSIHPIIQISNLVVRMGESEPFLRVIFTLNSCDPIEGVYICSYSSEGELLEAWQNFIHAVDPDILTGFNILNFDLWFIIERAQKLTTFKVDLGRSKESLTNHVNYTFHSDKYGRKEGKNVQIPGRVVLDLFRHLPRNHSTFQLLSYGLKNVAKCLLCDDPDSQKIDLSYECIPQMQEGPTANSATRREIAVYCLQDAKMPLQLLHKYSILEHYLRLGKEKHVPFANLLGPSHSLQNLGIKLANARISHAVISDL
ncbi:ribonuclease H-like protein [Armillaria gallica]|uniref:DNA polymerase delta catalytic subunit n=1 Tax=Armillaria gallica TaxID=47427 RepID=A0A2H3C8S0_ARMGA|nr:ribonuclease H-like protein [Armillaria gallica]